MAIKISPYRGGPALEVSITLHIPGKGRMRVRRKSPVTSKSGTKRWAEALEKELLTKGLETKPRLGPTLAEFGPKYLEWCKSEGRKFSTIGLRRSIFNKWLIPKMGKLKLADIKAGHVSALKAELVEKGYSKEYCNNILSVLRRILAVAADPDGLDLIAEVPVRITMFKLDRSKRRPFYEFDDFEHLVQIAGELDDRARLIVLLGAEAGLRIGETIELKWSDIDFRRDLIHIQRAVYKHQVTTPKGGRSRRVPMTHRLRAALQAHRHLKGDYVLYDDRGDRFTYKVAHGMFGKLVKRASLQGTTHWLRHTFCSHLAMKNAPVRMIQELAGHVSLETTLRYMWLSDGSTKSAIDLLNDRQLTNAVDSPER